MDTIRRGSSGPVVKIWQSILGSTAVDGQFGPLTETATKQWQTAYGLTADGVVGPMTWQKAKELGASFPDINTKSTNIPSSVTEPPVTTAELIPTENLMHLWDNTPRWAKWTLGFSSLLGLASAFMKKK